MDIRQRPIGAVLVGILASMGIEVGAAHGNPPLYVPPPPLPTEAEILPFDPGRVMARPSLALRHAVASEFAFLPAEGIPFEIRCMISPASGAVWYCESASPSPHLANAMQRLAGAYRFVVGPDTRQNQRSSLIAIVRDRITPNDRQSTDFLRQGALSASDVVITREPTKAEREFTSTPVSVSMRATCQVQRDFSLFCLRPEPIGEYLDSTTLQRSQDAFFALSALIRVAPTLRSGRPAAGSIVPLTLDLHAPPAPPAPPPRPSQPRERLAALVPSDAELLPFEPTRVTMRPAASVRHFLFQSVSVPAGGARLTLRCEVDRFDGQVTFCDTPEPQGRLEIRASWLAKFYQFALPQNVRLGPGRLAVEIDEHIQPIDPAPPITAPAPVDAQARFDRRPSSEELANLYPLVERHRGREATVSMDCEVMGDLTLFCINPIVAGMNLTQSNTLQFQLAALQVSSLFRASPQFGNGIQARGTRFYLSVPFRVASSGTPTGEESRQPGLQD